MPLEESQDELRRDVWSRRLKYIGVIVVAAPSIIAAWAGAFKQENVAQEVAGEAAVHIISIQKAVKQNSSNIDNILGLVEEAKNASKVESDSLRMLVVGFMLGSGKSSKPGSRTGSNYLSRNDLKELAKEVLESTAKPTMLGSGSPPPDTTFSRKQQQRVIMERPNNLIQRSKKSKN